LKQLDWQYFFLLPVDMIRELVRTKHFSPKDTDGNKPIDPVITLASSDKISPNKFSVKITSNCFGLKSTALPHYQQIRNLMLHLNNSFRFLNYFSP
jgi:hypothetical protein